MHRLFFCALLLLPMSFLAAQEKKPDLVHVPMPELLGDSPEKATLVLNPLGHVGAIKGVFFNRDGTQLISVGIDRTIQFWDVAGGQRLQVLRLPETPTAAALSPDGKTLAVGRWAQEKERKVFLVNLDDSRVLWLSGGEKGTSHCQMLTFSPDGDQLAGVVPNGSSLLWRGLKEIWEKNPEEVANLQGRPFTTQGPNTIRSLAFSADGKQLAVGCSHDSKGVRTAFVVDLPAGDDKPEREREGTFIRWFNTPAVAWSPDGRQLATATDSGEYYSAKDPSTRNPIRLWSTAERTVQKEVNLRPRAAIGLHFLNAEEILFTHYNWDAREPQGHGQKILHLTDPKKSRSGPFLKCVSGVRQRDNCPSAVSADGKLAVFVAGELGEEMVLWETRTGKELHHLGGKLGTPRSAGWSKDGSSLGFDAFEQDNKPFFHFALDLKELRLREKVDRADHLFRYRTNGDWSVKGSGPVWEIKHGDKAVKPTQGPNLGVTALALSPRPQPDYVAWAAAATRKLILAEPLTGKGLASWGGPLVFDLAPSPDGRYLLAVSDRQVAQIYRIADNPAQSDRTPLLSLFLSEGEWVLWTREGYYAASPGGEKLMGFAVDTGPEMLPSFHPAERFREHFHRPDVIHKTLELGSSIAAIRALGLHIAAKNARPALNPLGHVGAIQEVFYTPDGKHLLSVGKDKTAQLWDVAGGERVKVLRLPFEPTAAALAPDGKTLAVGRQARQGQRVFLVNLDDDRLVWLADGGNFDGWVTGLAFSADGDRLAAARQGGSWDSHGCFLWEGLKGVWEKKPADMPKGRQFTKVAGWAHGTTPAPRCLAFSPDGKRVAVGCDFAALDKGKLPVAYLVDVPVGDARPTPAVPLDIRGHARSVVAVAWAPNGERVVTAYTNERSPRTVEVWSADGKRQQEFNVFPRTPFRVQFLTAEKVLATWGETPHGKRWESGQSILDLTTKKEERLAFAGGGYEGPGAVSADGKLACLVAGGERNELVLWEVATGKRLHHLGKALGTPRTVGWSEDGNRIGFDAFQDTEKKPLFRFALDLKELELRAGPVDGSKYLSKYRSNGEWSLRYPNPKGQYDLEIVQGGKVVKTLGGTKAFTLSPAREPQWMAWHNRYQQVWNAVVVWDLVANKWVGALGPIPQLPYDLAPSPDGRFLVSVNDTQVAYIYRIADEPARTVREPLLNLYVVQGEWILWTKEGYYAASPGGEKLMGWTIDNGPDKLPTFYPAERFRKRLYRPDVIKLVFEKGTVAEALKAADAARGVETRKVNLDELVPPRALLTVVDESKLPTVKLKVQAEAASKWQPITSLRLMLDGRVVPGDEALAEFRSGQAKAEVEWTFVLPEGEHQLAVLARGPDSSAVSPSIRLKHVDVQKLPRLHVLAVGINNYRDNALDLKYAAPDAEALAAAFAKHCQGEPFREVTVRTLVNDQGTTPAILRELTALRKQVDQQDLLIVFFACHGIKQQKDYYLLTQETDMSDLAGTALSGVALRKALTGFKCQVLLMLDTCQAAGFGEGKKLANLGLKSATDDVARDLTDDDYGIAVMCAAMGHEKAEGRAGFGLFTRAVLDALEKKPGVPFNPFNRRVYVHHLHAYVFDQVSHHSDQRQHPFLSLPWVVESFVVR